jgi:hypothetical protein
MRQPLHITLWLYLYLIPACRLHLATRRVERWLRG